jgi:ANTAR domain
MAARLPRTYPAADITGHVEDLVLNCPDLTGFLEDLAGFCADQQAYFSGNVSCGITVLRASGVPDLGGSDEATRRLEGVQSTNREGPALAAALDESMVLVPDLRAEGRWPSFIDAARRQRVLSVLALPVPLEGTAKAVMSFYSLRPHGFGREAIVSAHTLAADASKGLRLVLRIASLRESEHNLRTAMADRSPIDTAVGVIIGQERCTQDVALEWLFRASRSRKVGIVDLAAEIVASAGAAHPTRIRFDE